MRLKNNIFAAAFDELKRNHGIKTQKELAHRMGVSEDTITRILKDRTEVTEDIITKLQTASGCIFNLQWLRGEDPYHMLAEDVPKPEEHPQSAPSALDPSSIMNAALAAQMQTIESLKSEKATILEAHARELHAKDDLIQSLREQISAKDQLIAEQKARLIDYRRIIDSHNGIEYPFPIGSAESLKNPNVSPYQTQKK